MSHQTDGSASKEALESVWSRLSEIQKRILAYVGMCGLRGATDREIERALRIDPKMNTRTRRNELVEMGLIVATGKKRESEYDGVIIGRKANIWVKDTFAWAFETDEPPKCKHRIAFAEAAEDLARTLKRLARDLRVTDEWVSDIKLRLEYAATLGAFNKAEYSYMVNHDSRALAHVKTEG